MSTKTTKVLERDEAIALLIARIQDRSTPDGVLESMMDVAYDDDLHNYVIIPGGGVAAKA
jgi:hypothetical protein